MTSSLTNILQVFGLSPTSATKSISKSSSDKSNELREIFLHEVANHDSYDDCWIVIYDRVYDVTKFLREHPGGDDIIIEHAGRDATLAFHGTGHSRDAIEMMRDYLIGELPPQQRIFRTETSQVLLRGIPE